MLSVDRWHPAAKIAEATGNFDLLHAAVAINGASSTAEYVLRYGPITFDWYSQEFRSLNRPELAPLAILQPLSGRTAQFQRAAMYCVHTLGTGSSLKEEFTRFLANNPDITEMARKWREFQNAMTGCYAALNSDASMHRAPQGWSPSDFLASVVQNIMFAVRQDFLSRLISNLTRFPEAAQGIVGDLDSEHQGGRIFQAQIRGEIVRMRFVDRNCIDMISSLFPAPIKSPVLRNLLKLAVGVKNLLTIGITATPEFGIKNAIRDTLCAIALGRKPQAPWGTLTGAKEEFARSEVGRDWLLQGGGFGSFYDHVLELDPARSPRFTVPRLDAGPRTVSWLKWIWKIYTFPFRALESGSRITQYRRMLASGATKREAIMQSRQISTDFADRGASQLWWHYCCTVPFLNAALQGMNQLRKVFFSARGTGGRVRNPLWTWRNSAHASGSAVRACLLSAISLSALTWNLSSYERESRYEAQSAYDKANYVYLYDVNGTDYRIPVPFELGAVFMKTPELLADRIVGADTVDTAGLKLGPMDYVAPPTVRSLVDSTILLSFTPAIIQPAYRILRNRDYFGRDIEPFYMKSRPTAHRYFSTTPLVLRYFAEAVPVLSPLQLKVLLEGHLGHMARLFLHGTEQLLWNRREHGSLPNPQFLYRATGRRAFIREGPNSYTWYVNDFERLTEAADYADRLCRWDPATCRENRPLIRAGNRANPFESRIRRHRASIREIRVRRSLSKTAKEDRIETLYNRINNEAERGLRAGSALLE